MFAIRAVVRRRRLLSLVLLLVLPARAESQLPSWAFGLSLGSNSRGYLADDPTSAAPFENDCGVGRFGSTGPYSAPPGILFAWPGNVSTSCSASTWDASISMVSAPGVLRTVNSVTTVPSGHSAGLTSLTRAIFVDQWTWSGGDPDLIRFGFDVTGSVQSSTAPGTAAAASPTLILYAGNSTATVQSRPIGTPPGPVAFDVETLGLSSLFLGFELRVFASLTSTDPLTRSVNGSIIADFSNTARLTTLSFFARNPDGSLEDISARMSLSAASGGDYPLETVPEPSTIALVGIGLLVVAARRGTPTGSRVVD